MSRAIDSEKMKPSYHVLARKWRSAQFSDIIGQNHVIRTLTNALSLNRIHPAYLFTGSRGTGKTSIARIFSKVLRCPHIQWIENQIHSCDQCVECQEITRASSLNVIEIDGASHNGVDSIREICENAQFLPAIGFHKIYLIDEVHMLTTAAFNALLKILEEPPSHLLFLFATTEAHKIPTTILSRCQRFDFHHISIHQLQTHLGHILQVEGLVAEEGVVGLIARAAEGSLRDALSVLDQVIAFSSGQAITLQAVRESIGLIEGQTLIGILRAVFQRKPLEAIACVDQAYQQGQDLRLLTRRLIEFLYEILLAKIGSEDRSGISVSREEWNELKDLAPFRSLEEMEMIFQVFQQGLEWIARSPHPKIVLDVLLIKSASAELLITVESLIPSAPSGDRSAQSLLAHPVSSSCMDFNPVTSQDPDQQQSQTWEGLIEWIKKDRPLLASLLENAQYEKKDTEAHGILSFSVGKEYYRDQLQKRLYQEPFLKLSKEYLGYPILIQVSPEKRSEQPQLSDFSGPPMIQVSSSVQGTGESIVSRKERIQKETRQWIQEQAKNHPLIKETQSLFGGELSLIDIKEVSHDILSNSAFTGSSF